MQNIRNFCIIAHIDHGKSTLADRFLELTGTVEKRKMQEQYLDQMELERERGITIKLQPVRMKYHSDNADQRGLSTRINADSISENQRINQRESAQVEYVLNLIDTPGHVDFSYEVSRSLAAVEGAILLIDATKGVQAQTLANLHLAQKQNLTIIPVINKVDLPNARVEEVEEEIGNLLATEPHEILKISAKTGNGVKEVLEAVIAQVSPPDTLNEVELQNERGSTSLRALIFDSTFDAYKGVIAFVRVFDGSVRVGQKIKLFATRERAEVLEVGYFSPQLKKDDHLESGQIGYIATGIKNPGVLKVGDTVFLENQSVEPLVGYAEPRPVVFASFYPTSEEGDDYDVLKDALGKLKLTDAALTYEPESSPGLGRGFRLGFLGMLHIEIVSERLRREYDLNLIVSTPSVEYHVISKNTNEVAIRSAAALPDPSVVTQVQEPFVKLELLSPARYLGQLMKLMSDTRSEYLATEYLTKEVVILKYNAPLAEIITDFYDRLKSISSGFASMSYEPLEYRAGDLARLDILIAGELVEPFSKIVPREKTFHVGRATVEKLKHIVPKQLFAVTLQAAIGGKIIARETISAMRKDVTGYLYGGDVTRKNKLLDKQKRGKARMKASGKVNLPQEVFLEMLRK